MVYVRSHQSRDQELINSILRPLKRRFPRGPIPGAQNRMKQYGLKHLKTYRPQTDYRYFLNPKFLLNSKFRYPTYYNFSLEKSVPNYQVPREGRTVRVTTTEGDPIIIGRKKIRSGQFRLQYRKITYHEQLVRAFGLFDDSIRLLEQVS